MKFFGLILAELKARVAELKARVAELKARRIFKEKISFFEIRKLRPR